MKSPTSFHLEAELLDRFRVACAIHKVTQSEVVAEALEQWLERTSTPGSKDRGEHPIGTHDRSVILQKSDVVLGTEVSEASEAFRKDYERASAALHEAQERFDELMERFLSGGEAPAAARKPAVGDGSEARRRGKGNTGRSGKRG